jgi:hypothetical protein
MTSEEVAVARAPEGRVKSRPFLQAPGEQTALRAFSTLA